MHGLAALKSINHNAVIRQQEKNAAAATEAASPAAQKLARVRQSQANAKFARGS